MAHTLDTTLRYPTTSTATNSANPVTTNYTCGAGTTVLIVGILYSGVQTLSGVTYNSIAMTRAGTAAQGISPYVDIWYLINPPTGSAYALSVPNPSPRATVLEIMSAKAATGYTSALDVRGGAASAGGTNPSTSITTTVNGDFVAAFVASGSSAWAPSASTHTQVYSGDFGTWGGASQYNLQATAGSITMGWTFGTSANYGINMVSFKEVPIKKWNGIYITKLNGVSVSKINGI